METLDQYLTTVRRTTSVAFVKQEPRRFLLKRPSKRCNSDAQLEQISFQTVLAKADVDPFASEWRVVPIQKREGNPYEDRISIGRASNCDIVLRLPFISKVQAHIFRDSDGAYSLRAQNTANPTTVNNHLVDADAICPLKVGDVIAFGPMKFEFVDAARLHKVLTTEIHGGLAAGMTRPTRSTNQP